jgi:hypothetical protein
VRTRSRVQGPGTKVARPPKEGNDWRLALAPDDKTILVLGLGSLLACSYRDDNDPVAKASIAVALKLGITIV